LLLLAVLGVRGIQKGRESTLESARAAAAGAVERSARIFQERIASIRAAAPRLRLYPLVPQPTESADATELYARAIAGPPEDVEQKFAMILRDHPDAVTAAGVPLRPLIAWIRLQRCEDPTECTVRAGALARIAVDEFPSLISGKLLEGAIKLLAERNVASDSLTVWRERWERDEQIRQVLSRAADGDESPRSRWVRDDLHQWWLEPEDDGRWCVFEESQLRRMASDAADEVASMLPKSTRLSIQWAERDVLEPANGETLAARAVGPLAVAAILTNPAELFRQQRSQTIWLAALLGIALLAVLSGFVAMQRALISERQLNQQKSDFVASVSHELRTPVSSMRLMLENLESGAVSTESSRQDYLRLLGGECHRLSALIENVLDFARIENDRKIYHMAEADVSAMIRDAVQLLQPRAAQRHQEIIAELEPIDPVPHIDALALQQTVINLVDNAMKFSPPETTITVSARGRDEKSWALAVADQGPGIPDAERSRIFERFYRISNELRRETQGAGIGLAIVKHTVEAHGGRIEVESASGRGTTFTLVLPYAGNSA
jgi:signal transduction histidine kinase